MYILFKKISFLKSMEYSFQDSNLDTILYLHVSLLIVSCKWGQYKDFNTASGPDKRFEKTANEVDEDQNVSSTDAFPSDLVTSTNAAVTAFNNTL